MSSFTAMFIDEEMIYILELLSEIKLETEAKSELILKFTGKKKNRWSGENLLSVGPSCTCLKLRELEGPQLVPPECDRKKGFF